MSGVKGWVLSAIIYLVLVIIVYILISGVNPFDRGFHH